MSDAARRAQLLQAREIAGGRHDHPAGAEDRLGDRGRGLAGALAVDQLEADLEKRVATPTDSAAQTGEEIALEGPARVLIRTDGNTDYVQVLGRRTRIGRGPDNEIVLDTKHVSRYHAVLLAGPAYTSIEDLKSTNGVFVNSKRVSRHVLKDGDRVTIGKSHFRFSVRN